MAALISESDLSHLPQVNSCRSHPQCPAFYQFWHTFKGLDQNGCFDPAPSLFIVYLTILPVGHRLYHHYHPLRSSSLYTQISPQTPTSMRLCQNEPRATLRSGCLLLASKGNRYPLRRVIVTLWSTPAASIMYYDTPSQFPCLWGCVTDK